MGRRGQGKPAHPNRASATSVGATPHRGARLLRLRKHPMRFPPLAVIGCFPPVPAGPPGRTFLISEWVGFLRIQRRRYWRLRIFGPLSWFLRLSGPGLIAEDDGGEGGKVEGEIAFADDAGLFRFGRVAVLGGLDPAVVRFAILCAHIPDEETEIGPAGGIVHGNDAVDIPGETGVSNPAVFGQKLLERSAPEHRQLFTQADEIPVQVNEAFVLMPPGIGATVVRIRPAYLTGFVRVIYGGRAGPGHLDGHGLAEDPLVDPRPGGGGAESRRTPDHPVGPREETGMIVVRQLVHRAHEGGVLKPGHFVLHDAEEGGAILIQVIPVGIGMLFHACEEPGDGLHKSVVVHDGVPFLPVQPGTGIAVMLGQDQGVGVDGLDPLAEALPELMVKLRTVAHVRGYVQPPSVNTVGRGEPFLRDLQDLLAQLGRILVIQLRKGGIAPPAFVHGAAPVAGVIEAEIGTVRTVDTLEGAGLEAGLSQIDPFVIHPLVIGAAVVEHTVQNNAHAPAVQLFAEGGEEIVALLQVFHAGDPADVFRRIAVMLLPGLHDVIQVIRDDAEMRIDMLVILTVVFMAGGGDKNRVEIKHLDAEILEIVQLVEDALQVAPVEAAVIRIGGWGVPVRHVLGVPDRIIILVIHHIVGRITVAEPIRKDLVLHGTLRPGGHMEPGNEAEGVGRIEPGHAVLIRADAALVIGDLRPVRTLDQKTVDHFRFGTDQAGFVIIEEIVAFYQDHERADGQGIQEQNDALRAAFRHADADHHGIARVRLRGETVRRGFVTEDSGEDGMTD